jgi:hypothetical protein
VVRGIQGEKEVTPEDKYNEITQEHCEAVAQLTDVVTAKLHRQAVLHDASKFAEPEMSGFMQIMPEFKKMEFMDEAYKKALSSDTIQHHYTHNRHHPEHFPNGISGMTLVDLVEMLCDWVAAKKRYSKEPFCAADIQKQVQRFNIEPQLAQILINTFEQVLAEARI